MNADCIFRAAMLVVIIVSVALVVIGLTGCASQYPNVIAEQPQLVK
jgi:hypothetical protein